MEKKYTNGKWEIAPNGVLKPCIWVGGTLIAQVAEVPHEGAMNNAKLIVSAPELLEALEYLLKTCTIPRFKCEQERAIEMADDIITKALTPQL